MSHDEVVDGRDAFALLCDGVPLSLLCDLAVPVASRELFDAEPGDTSWIPAPPPVGSTV